MVYVFALSICSRVFQRVLRDRVRASQMVNVPPELAAHINSGGGLSGSFRGATSPALQNPHSVLNRASGAVVAARAAAGPGPQHSEVPYEC